MCRFLKTLSAFAFGLSIAGCVTTQEMPLAPNVVRLDTQASGLLFAGQATGQTMRRAAELTLQNGYSHFRLEQAQVAQGSELAGVLLLGVRVGLWQCRRCQRLWQRGLDAGDEANSKCRCHCRHVSCR